MAEDPLGALFDRYRREGDLAALARVFEEVGPELLGLARYLRPRGQAPEDLVQTTFLSALTHRENYQVRRPIRPWLLGILLNKAATGRRQETELAAEIPGQDSPEDDAQALESARLVARGLERLPPIYSEVLREHFFGGLPPGAIAERLGRPPGTVRAQLHRGLRLLRAILPAGMAGWLAWLGPSRASLLRVRRAVLDEAASDLASVSLPAGAPPLAGARVASASAIALAGVVGLRAWTSEPQPGLSPQHSPSALASEPSPALRAVPERERDEVLASYADQPESAATHGELLLRVRFPDGTPADGVGLRIYAWGEPSWSENRSDAVTDAAGEHAIASIHAGRVGIYCDRGGDEGFGVTVHAGERAVREIDLPPGVQLSGEVVDARGTPVAGAGLWLSESPLPSGGRIALQCDELGRFELRDLSPHRFIGARAPGYAPSDVEWLASGGLREGSAAKLRLVLPDAGGSLAGSVVDAGGISVPGAVVVVRAAAGSRARLRADGALLGPSTPLEATTDARGRFAFVDLALGELELRARAQGHPEYFGSAQLSSAQPHGEIELRLLQGGRLRGTVRHPDGQPAVKAVVIATTAGRGMVDREVDARGEYVLEGLLPGTIDAQAGFGHAGEGQLTQATLSLEPGGELTWDPVLERPVDFTGRVVGPRGEPLPGAWLRAVATEHRQDDAALPDDGEALAAWLFDWPDRSLARYLGQIAADGQGRFTLAGVPRPFAVEVRLPDGRRGWPVQVFDPPPAHGELALSPDAHHSAGLSGTVAGLDGQPLAFGEVFAVLRTGGGVRERLDGSGAFRFESLPEGTFDVLVWSRGHRPQIVATAGLAAGEQRDLGWLQLAP